jgi:hypothetical protein
LWNELVRKGYLLLKCLEIGSSLNIKCQKELIDYNNIYSFN